MCFILDLIYFIIFSAHLATTYFSLALYYRNIIIGIARYDISIQQRVYGYYKMYSCEPEFRHHNILLPVVVTRIPTDFRPGNVVEQAALVRRRSDGGVVNGGHRVKMIVDGGGGGGRAVPVWRLLFATGFPIFVHFGCKRSGNRTRKC